MNQKFKYFVSLLITLLVLSACGEVVAPGETEQPETTAIATETPVAAETATTAPTDTPEDPSNRTSDIDGMKMVLVPAGEFIMGCEGTSCTVDVWPGPFPDNMVQSVFLNDYWIDKYPVTIGQYNQCVAVGACRPYGQNNIPPQGLAYFIETEYHNYPVVNVSWYYARDYCAWAGRRLPTEAEWEKAARGTNGQKYPWGDEPYTEDKGNICDKNCPSGVRGNVANPNFDDGYRGPSPVGSYTAGASPYGALDMFGNVWEWTSTASVHYPYDANDEREAQYDIADGEKWPERILRGGPWNDGLGYQRSSFRYRAVAIYWNMNMGFRCAVSE
jgi:formylglycine-generating enzyme required for sulfatase activity